MRLRLRTATVLGVSAAAARAGDVEWARQRGVISSSRAELAFAGGAAGVPYPGTRRRLLRPRAAVLPAGHPASTPSISTGGDPRDSADYQRRSFTRALYSKNAKDISKWMATLRNDEGPEMPFDEMLDVWDDTEKLMRVSKESRQWKASRRNHFDLRRNPNLLTKNEEIELGRKVQELQRWERVRAYLETRLGRTATMEEWAVELATMDGVEGLEKELRVMKAAREKMISCNLRLVLFIARKKFYSGASAHLKVSLQDMIQDGTAGLVKAVERYDPEKGFRFTTYATWWVHQTISGGLADCGRVVRLPMHLHAMVTKVVRLQSAMLDQLGRQPTVEELSLQSGLEIRQVKKCLDVGNVEPISLDGQVKPRGGHLYFDNTGERLGDNMSAVQEEPVDGADLILLKTDVATILGDLSAREAYVLRMRFGLGGSSPSTLDTVGEQLLLTRERVRQIQLAAIRKLRGKSPNHEALYSDRAMAGEKEPAKVSECDDNSDTADEQHGLPSPMLMDSMKHSSEPREDEMLDYEGRVVTGAKRRQMLEAAQAKRAAAAAARLNGKDGGSTAKKKRKKRGFVMRRAHSPRRRRVMPLDDEGRSGGDVAAMQNHSRPEQRNVDRRTSLQAA